MISQPKYFSYFPDVLLLADHNMCMACEYGCDIAEPLGGMSSFNLVPEAINTVCNTITQALNP